MTVFATILLSSTPFLVIAGMWMWKRPPKRINPTVGYRSKRSMQDQAQWDFAQGYSGRFMAFTGIILFGVGGLSFLLPEMTEWIQVVLALCVLILSCVMVFRATEKALANRFNQKG